VKAAAGLLNTSTADLLHMMKAADPAQVNLVSCATKSLQEARLDVNKAYTAHAETRLSACLVQAARYDVMQAQHSMTYTRQYTAWTAAAYAVCLRPFLLQQAHKLLSYLLSYMQGIENCTPCDNHRCCGMCWTLQAAISCWKCCWMQLHSCITTNHLAAPLTATQELQCGKHGATTAVGRSLYCTAAAAAQHQASHHQQ
jgi:hypothetical protein